jgi:hypothetical protein
MAATRFLFPFAGSVLLTVGCGSAPAPTPAPTTTTTVPAYNAQVTAILAEYRESYRPCVTLPDRMGVAMDLASKAIREGRDKDFKKHTKDLEALRAQAPECIKAKEPIVERLKATGAPDAAMQAAWTEFVDSLKAEATAAPATAPAK